MGFLGIFSGGPFDFDGNGKTDAGEMALGFIMMDELGKVEERERKRQELISDLLHNAALSGLEFGEAEIQEFLADAERNGSLD